MAIVNKQTFRKNEDGSMELISETQVELIFQSPEEEIAEKEAKLLEMYAELQALKEKQTN